jgi:hypothetical protein
VGRAAYRYNLRKMSISITKRVLLFWGIGAVVTLAIAGASSVSPPIFGFLTVPFWFLPGLAGFGAHDSIILPLGLLSGSMVYGAVAFFVFRLVTQRKSKRSTSNGREP